MNRIIPLVGALFLTTACAGSRNPKNKSNLRAEAKEHEMLDKSAQLYWDAVRWGDGERAAVFIEMPDEQVRFKDWLEWEREKRRMEDFTLVQAILGPEKDKKAAAVDGHLRDAKVFVRVSGYEIPAQILETSRVNQKWYRTVNGWYLDWDVPEEYDEVLNGGG